MNGNAFSTQEDVHCSLTSPFLTCSLSTPRANRTDPRLKSGMPAIPVYSLSNCLSISLSSAWNEQRYTVQHIGLKLWSKTLLKTKQRQLTIFQLLFWGISSDSLIWQLFGNFNQKSNIVQVWIWMDDKLQFDYEEKVDYISRQDLHKETTNCVY